MDRRFNNVIERLCSDSSALASDCLGVMDQEMSWIHGILGNTEHPEEPKRATREYIQFLDTLSQETFVVVSLFSRYSLLCELTQSFTSVFPDRDHPWIVEYSSEPFSVCACILLLILVSSIPPEPLLVQCSFIVLSSLD